MVKEYEIRERKVEQLRQQGIEPYAYKFERTAFAEDVKSKHSKLKAEEANKRAKIKLAGRLMTFRNIGKLVFSHMQDVSGKIQLIFEKSTLSPEKFKLFEKLFDPGDIVGVSGYPYRTKAGELSLWVTSFELLAKSVRGLPDKWHGFTEVEERYRRRYVDLIMNRDVQLVFERRAKMLEIMREFMKAHKFIEVETPLLQPVYGGAFAKPFKTHCNALNMELYLSIAPELPLKKAIIGGLDRVYEITKKFRNEDVDRDHTNEHMTIEWYQSYADYNDGMKLFEELIKTIAKQLYGKLEIEYQGHRIDLGKWQRLTLFDAVKKYLGVDVSKVKTDAEAKKLAKEQGVADPSGVTKGSIADELMKLFRGKLIQPTFLTDYPIELAPLAKPKRGDPTKAEIFQPFIGGMEVGRAYSELNDPALQAAHFREQEDERKRGNLEAMPTDSDFVRALEYGMPPACGVGIGIERLVMLFTNQYTIRDVILFPTMRREKDEPAAEKPSEEEIFSQKSLTVGKILKIKQHPHADKLKICDVDVGSAVLKIVCGCSNLKEGLCAAVAHPGTKVFDWEGSGKVKIIKAGEIRGVRSEGMLCAPEEIGLHVPPAKREQLLELKQNVRLGAILSEVATLKALQKPEK